jgi:hypothetical protein
MTSAKAAAMKGQRAPRAASALVSFGFLPVFRCRMAVGLMEHDLGGRYRLTALSAPQLCFFRQSRLGHQ